MTCLIAFCSAQASLMRVLRFGPRPGTSMRRPGSSSMICMMPAPKWLTIRSAMTGPMPLIRPNTRYLLMPCSVAGSTVV